jgi:hypothetical protein
MPTTNHSILHIADMHRHLFTYGKARSVRAFAAILTAAARGAVVARPVVYTREMQRWFTVRL